MQVIFKVKYIYLAYIFLLFILKYLLLIHINLDFIHFISLRKKKLI